MFKEERNRMKNLLSEIPLSHFIVSSQLVLVVFIFLSYFLIFEAFHILFIIFLVSVIAVSTALLFLTDYTFDLLGFAILIFVLFGVSMISLQMESILARGTAYLIEMSFLLSSFISIALGLYLFISRAGDITKKSIYFILWIYSFLLLLYIPLSNIYLIKPGFGHGELSIMSIGLPLSIISTVLNVAFLKEEESVKNVMRKGNLRRLFGDHTGAKLFYEKNIDEVTKEKGLLTLLADMEFHDGNFSDAVRYYQRCLDFSGARNYHRISYAQFQMRSFSDAFENQKTAISKRGSAEDWLLMGKIAGGLNEPDKKSEYYHNAIERDEWSWEAHHEISRFTDDEDERRYHLRKALETGEYTPYKRKVLKDLEGVGSFVPVFLHPADTGFWNEDDHSSTEFEISHIDVFAEALISSLEIKDPYVWDQIYEIVGSVKEKEGWTEIPVDEEQDTINEMIRALLKTCIKETDAIPDLERLIGTKVEREASYTLGVIYGLSGDHSKSIHYFEKITTGKLMTRALAAKGVVHYMQGDLGRAMGSLNTAAALGYRGNDIWDTLALVAERLGEDEQSYYYLSKKNHLPLHLRCSKEPTVFADVLECAQMRGYDKALKYAEMIDKGGTFSLERAILLMFNGLVEEAMKILNGFLKNDPEQPDVLFCRGVAKMYQKRPNEAIQDIQKAIDFGEGDPLYLFYKGLILYRKKDFKEALTSFRYVSKRRPNWDKNRYYLTICKGRV